MPHQVLYFPYISVPEDAWFTRVLLYWDKVGSIVPAPYVEQQRKLSPYMQDLLAASLVTPVVPENHVDSLYEPMEHFLQFVDQGIAQGDVRPGAFGTQPTIRGAVEPGTVFEIHRGKLGELTAQGLMDRDLARPVEGRDWYAVESRTAEQYMTYLATALGASVGMHPITDSAAHLASFTSARDAEAAPVRLLEELRASVLESLLPAPSQPVSVNALADFKEDYGDLLGGFRRQIEDGIVDLALIEETWARAHKREAFRDELSEQVDEIRARMEERQWPKIVLGTVCGLIGAAIPGAREAIAGDPVAAALAAPAFVAAMYLGIPKLRPVKEHLSSPLAYAALAQERLS